MKLTLSVVTIGSLFLQSSLANYDCTRRNLEAVEHMETAQLMFHRRALTEEESGHHFQEHLLKQCGDVTYEVGVLYTAGPHFFLGVFPVPDENGNNHDCPLLGFLPEGTVYTADKMEVLQKEEDFPTHLTGKTTLSNVIDAFETIDSVTSENVNVDTNSCEFSPLNF